MNDFFNQYKQTTVLNQSNETTTEFNNPNNALNIYVNSGFLFVIICLNFTNLIYNHSNLKLIKEKLNKTLSMKTVFENLINKYV